MWKHAAELKCTAEGVGPPVPTQPLILIGKRSGERTFVMMN
jgi:hypothetical protein